eukprot:c27709_g1_i1 orf=144-1970(-)
MGGSHSREGNLDESESEDESSSPPASGNSDSFHSQTASPADSLDKKLESLSLHGKAAAQSLQQVKLYRHIGGHTPRGNWVLADKSVSWEFFREGDGDEGENSDGEDSWRLHSDKQFKSWFLLLGNKVRARVDARLQMKFFDDQLRSDFIYQGVWGVKFTNKEDYNDFVSEYQNCLFENTYLLEATEENKIKVFGKDFLGWSRPEDADDSIWEDAEESFEQLPSRQVEEAFREAANGGIQSLAMGALDHSFLVSDTGIEAVKNTASGIHGKGVSVSFAKSLRGETLTPKKAMLMRGERNMMILAPAEDYLHTSGVHQLDIESGKVVTEWKFEKDGTPITMKDMTNDSKGSQLDPSGSTFLGLDDNRLCRWDMRDRYGKVQDIVSPVLNWTEGHQFSRGTNFECFAATGDGCIVVGSKDGKVRLYGTTSMRMAKTAFPGLGYPITHVDVTYDGLWVLATTDSYLILISTMFKDKDGKTKTGFTGRMGNKIAAPRLLKLTPLDAYHAGKNHKFRGGRFSWVTESGRQERHLVASVGNFTVIWNFRRVKDSNHACYQHTQGLKSCYCYKIVPKEESIVDSKFMHDNYTSSSPEAPLVVATPKNVSSFNLGRE